MRRRTLSDDDEFEGSSDEAFKSEDERSCASDEEDEDEEDEKEGDKDEENKKSEDDDMQTLLKDAAETLEEGWDAFYKDGVVYFAGGDQLINGSDEGAIAAHSAKFGKVLWFIPQICLAWVDGKPTIAEDAKHMFSFDEKTGVIAAV
uniref:Uncharacterized protein n=1 Tax=Chromera velia CCMP2878 TaxID=1169474 RepID=A0A0G4HXM4_9ALVE|eukprot:Cvel_9297.t1-p1 / transcript=Cvel_9297.t1 / gene=Cvel_9297 / organism=Chromera_velia_CCMP2878 / gene_product=hypothetical protein / transcript_product=hypothetical protein / location=Cvel_scaffold532:37078-37515(-) / protein_length=146 / sequence_SO=supercontig / SO=protein_coding / is_pseudo=false